VLIAYALLFAHAGTNQFDPVLQACAALSCLSMKMDFFNPHQWMRVSRWLAAIGAIGLLSACVQPPSVAERVTAATPSTPPHFCTLRVEGNQILDERNRPVILHGANLPTIAEMNASAQKPGQRLQQLAEAGAKIVRLPVDEDELLPAFVPATLIPVIEAANRLGMVAVVRLHTKPENTLNDKADATEKFMRQVMAYPVSATSGLWLEPFDRPLNSGKERNTLQALVDIVRAYRRELIVLVSNTDWMLDGTGKALISGGNVVYGADVERMNQYPLKQAPFMFPNWMSRSVAEDDLGIGIIATTYDPASEGLNGKILREYWQRQNAKYGNDLLSCP